MEALRISLTYGTDTVATVRLQWKYEHHNAQGMTASRPTARACLSIKDATCTYAGVIANYNRKKGRP